ncbi:MAG TPA: heavy metal-associated domain-containing protein [Saprospiraceae bacterium]|nr:heavy metal-associated domain-containing protein [Saprospiraceae bacterium]
MKQVFEVENIKCGGCMSTIRKGLENLPGVQTAEPENTQGTVTVDFDETIVSADQIVHKLSSMGYPLAGKNNLGAKAVSYVSCMIGRVTMNDER